MLRCILLLALLATPIWAVSADEPAASQWTKTCGKDGNGQPICIVEQTVLAMPQKALVLHIAFARGAGGMGRFEVRAPLGVILPPGISLSVDGGKSTQLPFQRCSAQGCDADATLDKTALDIFLKGKVLLAHYTVNDKQGFDISIKLDGLPAAFATLSQ
jgi:invasion protein IalB